METGGKRNFFNETFAGDSKNSNMGENEGEGFTKSVPFFLWPVRWFHTGNTTVVSERERRK